MTLLAWLAKGAAFLLDTIAAAAAGRAQLLEDYYLGAVELAEFRRELDKLDALTAWLAGDERYVEDYEAVIDHLYGEGHGCLE